MIIDEQEYNKRAELFMQLVSLPQYVSIDPSYQYQSVRKNHQIPISRIYVNTIDNFCVRWKENNKKECYIACFSFDQAKTMNFSDDCLKISHSEELQRFLKVKINQAQNLGLDMSECHPKIQEHFLNKDSDDKPLVSSKRKTPL